MNGNMTGLTAPSHVEHGFGYNAVNKNTSYVTPVEFDGRLGRTPAYTYNDDFVVGGFRVCGFGGRVWL